MNSSDRERQDQSWPPGGEPEYVVAPHLPYGLSPKEEARFRRELKEAWARRREGLPVLVGHKPEKRREQSLK